MNLASTSVKYLRLVRLGFVTGSASGLVPDSVLGSVANSVLGLAPDSVLGSVPGSAPGVKAGHRTSFLPFESQYNDLST